MSPQRKRNVAIAAALLTAVLTMSGCGKSQPAAAAPGEPATKTMKTPPAKAGQIREMPGQAECDSGMPRCIGRFRPLGAQDQADQLEQRRVRLPVITLHLTQRRHRIAVKIVAMRLDQVNQRRRRQIAGAHRLGNRAHDRCFRHMVRR